MGVPFGQYKLNLQRRSVST